MKLVCISDTHTEYEKAHIPDGDVLIVAGDIDLYNLLDAIRFNNWLKKLPHKYKIVIGGNHDKWLAETNKHLVMDTLDSCIYLNNSGYRIGDINFWGSPITPTFNDWYFMANRGDEIARYWRLIPKNTDVLITHGPPYSILDFSPYGKEHVGCWDLFNTVKKIKPKLHVFGHIHIEYGEMSFKNTKFINCSMMDENYQLVNQARVEEI